MCDNCPVGCPLCLEDDREELEVVEEDEYDPDEDYD